MNHYPSSVKNVIRQLNKLPGIGLKTAERLAMHLLSAQEPDVLELSRSIGELKQSIRLCSHCFALSDAELCRICSNPSRDHSLLCVVENQADMVAIENAGAYTGVYHILQGLLSPMDNVGPDDIRIKELMAKIEKGNIAEVIIATGTHVEGEATASYISDCLTRFSINITRIASGVPMGGELKYVDQVTLKKAMEARHAL